MTTAAVLGGTHTTDELGCSLEHVLPLVTATPAVLGGIHTTDERGCSLEHLT